MSQEKYKPSPEELQSAEEKLTDEQKSQSEEREQAFATLRPPVFNSNSATALLNIDKRLVYTEEISDQVTADGFEPKSEFHTTIVGFRTGKAILEALKRLPSKIKIEKLKQINSLIESTDWTIASKPKLYKISKEYKFTDRKTGSEKITNRTTIIQTLDLSGLNDFYDKLENIVDVKIKRQFPHLTLFTKGTDAESKKGIGIDSEEDFLALNPEPVDFQDK